jgi:serine/threonine protein kinase
VIHRDIKPDNIRITPDGTAVLVDLGNAKEAADGARTLFFIRHQGTPGYAPLEQYPGGSGTDARSDVYALGGTLYFALTAHEPPSVSTRQSAQPGQPDLPSLQQMLANNPPEDSPNPVRSFRLGVTKPSKPAPRHSRHLAQLGTLPPELLERLNVIIQKAMAMNPKNRYQSVAEFAADLRAVRAALPAAGVARVPDTHSTQPDLPMLYESLQAAREQAAAESSGGGDAVVKAGALAMFCPRCNAPIIAQATFCPRCGTALTPSSAQNRQNSGGTDVSAAGESKVTGGQARGDIAAEQTLIIAPQPSGGPSSLRTGTAQTNMPQAGQRGASPSSSMTQGQGGVSQASAFSAQGQGHVMSSMMQQRQVPPMVADTSDASGSKIDLKWLLIMAVIVAILLIVMILLLTQIHHGGSGFVGIPRVLLYQLLGGFRGRSFPGRTFTTITDFAAGIW